MVILVLIIGTLFQQPSKPLNANSLKVGRTQTDQTQKPGRAQSSQLKDRAHLSTFKIFIFEKFSCFIVLVVFLVIVQSSELVSVWFCEKMTFFPIFFSYHIFAIYVGGASLGLPSACRLIAVSAARLPSVDGLVVMCIKMHHHVKSAITICSQFIQNMFRVYTCIPTHRGSAPVFYLQKAPSWGIYVNWINVNPSMDK